jgi:hypothetical protein
MVLCVTTVGTAMFNNETLYPNMPIKMAARSKA